MITCTFEDGGKGLLRHVTVDAIFMNGSKILLVKRAAHISEGGKYCMPGGFMNMSESLIEGLLREVQEESGYTGINPQLFRINDNPNRRNEDRQNVSLTFIVEKGKLIAEPDNEVTEVTWFDLAALPSSDEIAFDHGETIELYKNYRDKQFSLPVIGLP